MNQVAQIDIEKYLMPISSDNPAGQDLKYEGTYDRIQEARRDEDESLPVGVWETKRKKADWRQVRELCLEALETKTKDIQITVWLLESLINLGGFDGAITGFKFINALCEAFWDDLYPKLDGESNDYRISPLIWMNEKISIKLKLIPVTHPETDEVYSYTWADWEKAVYEERISAQRERTAEGGKQKDRISRAKFITGVTLTRIEFYKDMARQLKELSDEINVFERFLESKLETDAPTLHAFKEVIMDISQFTVRTLEEREPVDEHPENISDRETGEEQLKQGTGRIERIRSRAEAYQLLSEAAEYLIRTEPHSPAPYLVKRAILWGNMPLSEVLNELVENEGKVKEIYKLLGIKDDTL